MLHNLKVSIDRGITKSRPLVSRISGAGVPLLIAIAALAAVFAIAASPFLLVVWEKPKSIDWNRLGEIGQAYDGTSAMLSAIALLGVVASLVIQARQNRNDRVQHSLDRQFSLLSLVLERPGLYGPLAGWPHEDDRARQYIFMSMWMNVLQMRFEMNTQTEAEVRKEIQMAFTSDLGRQWWQAEQSWWNAQHATNKVGRIFDKMMHEEYAMATANSDAPLRRVIRNKGGEPRASHLDVIAGSAIGVCIGLLVGGRLKSR
jgi:hypothetical protein